MAKNSIVVLGAGELGMAILEAITSNPLYSKDDTVLTVMLRPSSVNSPAPEKQAQLRQIRSMSVSIVSGDTDNDAETQLADIFTSFNTVIHAGGMTASPGTQMKITKAVLAAGVRLYVPWQFGVDYDTIGPSGGFGLFAEQYHIRELLRSQKKTQWIIVSNGIFTSFIFEEFWGVVTKLDTDKIKVTALNSWDDRITATTARDIGRCTAELVLNAKAPRNQAVYIAGDTLTYRDFASVIERETGKEVLRDVWPLEELKEKARQDPDNKLRKYHVVFSEGKGLSWPREQTWNAEKGMEMQDVASWIRENWSEQL
jgi:NmrA-like family